jgi:hypothetical protein
MNSESLKPPKLNEARRSQRVIISIRVVVSGKRPRGQTFVEETVTSVINAHGALVLLGEPVDSGQLLTIRNAKSGKERLCSVVGIGHQGVNQTKVGIEFAAPASHFWQIPSPPEDWAGHGPESK